MIYEVKAYNKFNNQVGLTLMYEKLEDAEYRASYKSTLTGIEYCTVQDEEFNLLGWYEKGKNKMPF